MNRRSLRHHPMKTKPLTPKRARASLKTVGAGLATPVDSIRAQFLWNPSRLPAIVPYDSLSLNPQVACAGNSRLCPNLTTWPVTVVNLRAVASTLSLQPVSEGRGTRVPAPRQELGVIQAKGSRGNG